MTDEQEPNPEQRPRWIRRVLIALGLFIALTIFALWISNEVVGRRGRSKLAELEARIEVDDPRWRWEHIDADRPILTNAENAVTVMEAVVKAQVRMDSTETTMPDGKGILDELPINRLLDAERKKKLLALLEKQKTAVALALTVREYPRGRAPVVLTPDVISTLLPRAQDGRDVARLLEWDAERALQDNRPEEVVQRIEAILRTGDALRDEPFLIAQLVRVAIRTSAARVTDHLLGLSEPADPLLARLQAEFARQRQDNLLLVGLRSERAAFNVLFANLRSGAVPLTHLLMSLGTSSPPGWERLGMQAGGWLYGSRLDEDHASALEWLTRACDVARLPFPEQPDAWRDYERDFLEFVRRSRSQLRNLVTVLILPAQERVARATLRDHAYLSTLETALAVERFRRKQGHWPATLAELTPTLLKEVPTDPYTRKPLRYHIDAEGCVIYSTGRDGSDDGGKKLLLRDEPGTDIGVRLWNPAQRRLPAK
ncbi:MAG: hypothetical protein U0840_16145 [Gemmataceae bacterium]